MRLLMSEPALAVASPLPPGVVPVIFRVGETPGRFEAAFLSRDLNLGGARDAPAPGFAGFVAALAAEQGLRWLHLNSAGADRPQYKALMARGVTVTTSAGANAMGVAQSAVGAVMALSRGFPKFMAAQAAREWRSATMPFPPDLAGQTALVVGLGPVGNEVGRLLAAIGLKVHGLSRSAREVPPPGVLTAGRYADMAALLPATDWLCLCCPISDLTRGLVDATAIGMLPQGAHIVNVARGGVMDEAAALAALQSGHLAGAYVDVFEQEPLPHDSPWWGARNTMISPHAAGPAAGNMARAAGCFRHNLDLFLVGKPLRNLAEI